MADNLVRDLATLIPLTDSCKTGTLHTTLPEVPGTVMSREAKCSTCCETCFRHFPNIQEMSRHMTIHEYNKGPAKNPFMCDICDKTFKTYTELKTHELKHMPEGQRQRHHDHDHRNHRHYNRPTHSRALPALDMDDDMLLPQELEDTLQLQAQDAYKCDTCGQSFKDEPAFKIHKIVHYLVS